MSRQQFFPGALSYIAFAFLATAILFLTPHRTAEAQPLPDLVISNIEINSDCQLQITVTNQGTGPVPQSAYQSPGGLSVSFFKDGASFGGWGLDAIDPQGALTNPGASVSWLREGYKLNGTAQIRVSADIPRNVVAESNENNNSLTKTFSCTPQLPDLGISQADFTPDCRARFQIENVGDAPLPNSAFRNEGVHVQRYLDGKMSGQIMLMTLDPTKSSQQPGGSKQWTDGSQYRASNTIKYALRKLGQEWSTGNNAMQVPVPANCQVAVQQPPDLIVSNIALDNQCRLQVTLTNSGPGPMPLSAYDPISSPSINLYKDGAAFGGWGLNSFDPQQTLTSPGNSVTWTRNNPQIAGTVDIRVNIDAAQELEESNEANNDFTQTVCCGECAPEPDPEPEPAPAESAPSLPDLTISRVTYTRDCHPSIRLENLGSPLNKRAYRKGGAYVQRFEDNKATARIPLLSVDPRRTLLTGRRGVGWVDNSQIKATRSVRYQLGNIGEEADTRNNTGQVNIPRNCRVTQTAPQVRPIQRAPLRAPLQRR
ncbi:CARDB domain-containing protein [Pseudomonadota bacterium]